jgi:hypothetical protein
MKKLFTLAIASIAIATTSVYAEQIDLGGYFTINVPRSWEVTNRGKHVHAPEDYIVFEAIGSSGIQIHCLNEPTNPGITLAQFNSWTEADLPTIAAWNKRTGYTLPVVRKIEVNGIPMLLFKQKRTDGSGINALSLEMWPGDKHFMVVFFYRHEKYLTINSIIDSIKLGTIPAALVPRKLVPAGIAGEEI